MKLPNKRNSSGSPMVTTLWPPRCTTSWLFLWDTYLILFPLLTLVNQSINPSLLYLHLANLKLVPFSWYCCVSIDFLQLWYYGKETLEKSWSYVLAQKVTSSRESLESSWCSKWYQKSCKLQAYSTGFNISEKEYFFSLVIRFNV